MTTALEQSMPHQDSLSLQYALTPEEIASGLKRVSRRLRTRTPMPTWISAFFWLAIVLLAFSIFQLLSLFDRLDPSVTGDFTLFVLLFSLGFVSVRIYWRLALRQTYRHLAGMSAAGDHKWILTLSPDSLTLQTPHYSLQAGRSLIESVEANSELRIIQAFLRTGGSIDIPYRAFGSDDERNAFVAQLRSKSG
ncbi:MAG TPA: hypothetical protein VH835_03375 [Dongiaceae bacterium]